MRTVTSRVASIATSILLVAAIAYAVLSATGVMGAKAVISDSMCASKPGDFCRGDLLITHKVAARDLRRGDVVSVYSDIYHRTVSHRIDMIQRNGAVLLRGDANDGDDSQAYQLADAPVVIGVVPHAGWPLLWLPTLVSRIGLLLALSGMWLLIAVLRAPSKQPIVSPAPASASGLRRH